MDTILYFYPLKSYQSRTTDLEQEQRFQVSEYPFSIYRLVKVGLTPRSVALLEKEFSEWQEWQREYIAEQEYCGKQEYDKKQEYGNKREYDKKQEYGNKREYNKKQEYGNKWEYDKKRRLCHKGHGKKNGFFFGRIFGNIGSKKRRKQWEKERRELLDDIFRLWGEVCSTYCVCQSPITYFNKWEFTDYREDKWVEYLLQHGTLAHFVLLGSEPCLCRVLPKYAKGMKSLRLFLREREFTEELEELLEDLFEEYGLASDIHFLEEDTGYKKLPPLSAVPCNILDFTGETKVSHWAAEAGSIWIDFDGNEEKQHRIESRKGAVQYFSLRKEWRQPQAGDVEGH